MMQKAAWWPTTLLLTSCAFYSQEDGERLNNEVYALQTQVTALQQSLSQLQEQEAEQRRQLAQMVGELAGLSKAARRNDADIGVQIDEVLETVARVRGQVESFNERVSTLEAQSSKVEEELEVRFQGLAEQQKIDEARSTEERKKAIDQARRRERLLGDSKAALAEVKKLLANKAPADARRLLRELILRNESARSFRKYRPEAQFLIGETYFAEKKYQQAAAEYNSVRTKHPKSPQVADALYKLGMCFEKLNLPKDAKLFYETVRKKYRRSKAGQEAKKRLDALK